MNSLDLLSMAIRNLFKRKLRTLLTVFGVVIGTSAIVVMVSLGIALNENFINEMSNWGNLQVINVSNPAFYGGISYDADGNVKAADKKLVLDEKMFEKFSNMQYVEAVTPIVEEYLIIGAGKLTTSARVIGVYPEAMQFLGLKATEGRLLLDGDTTQIVMGKQIPLQFTNPNQDWRQQMTSRNNEPEPLDVMDEKLIITFDWSYGTRNADRSIKSTKVECVGILEGDGYDKAYSIYMPITQLKKIQDARAKYEQSAWGGNNNNNKKIKGYQQCWVKVSDMKEVVGVQDQIKELGFEAWSQAEYLDSMNNMMQGIQMFLGAIGGVALFVAAIGIINTMIMSIYERTREIGVMKVIGASLGDIAKLFLVEAAFIGFLGGLAGLVFSYTISYLLNTYGSDLMAGVIGGGGGDVAMKVSSIPIWLALSALIFASIIGIIAGFLPARRAMKLSALSAIRTE